jgi:hypothetical protein
MPATAATTDLVLQRVASALVLAVLGLVVTEAWRTWRAWQDGRARDRAILSALLREVAMIRGIAGSIARDIDAEGTLVAERARWRLKPLLRFPAGIYDLVKDRPPAALLKHEGALGDLVRLQVQCAYTNALADEQQKWKTPDARDQPDLLEAILSFHPAVLESVGTVVGRCDRLAPILRSAGEAVGGLNLHGPPD